MPPSSTNERLFGPSESLDIDLLKHGKTEFFNQAMEFYSYFTVSLKKKHHCGLFSSHWQYQGNLDHKDCKAVCNCHIEKSSETLLTDRGNLYPGKLHSTFRW